MRPASNSAKNTGFTIATLLTGVPAFAFGALPGTWWGIAIRMILALIWLSATSTLFGNQVGIRRIYGASGSGFVIASILLGLSAWLDGTGWKVTAFAFSVVIYITTFLVIKRPIDSSRF